MSMSSAVPHIPGGVSQAASASSAPHHPGTPTFEHDAMQGLIPMIINLALLSSVPFLLGLVASYREILSAHLSKRWAMWKHEHIRIIEYVASTDYYVNLQRDNRNSILQKAILMYVADKKRQQHQQRKSASTSYIEGGLVLIEPAVPDDERSYDGSPSVSSSEQLKKLKLATMPAEGIWEEVDDGIFLMHTEVDQPAADSWERQTLFTYTLKTSQVGGEAVIDAFLEKCMKEYKEVLRKQEDKARYLYQMQLGMSKTESNGLRPPVFKRYKLSEDRTFESIFFPHKTDTMRLIDDFLQKRGKFAIEGFPQKLGLLLHGPPGTGKTSFVKALATYTKRHIIAVPLAKITTNQELYDIMFERVFPCLGDDGVPQRMSFEDIIFLIEEIDAATDIVKSRKTRPNQESTIMKAESCVFESMTSPAKPLDGAETAPESSGPKSTAAMLHAAPSLTCEPSCIVESGGASDGAVEALLVNLTGGDALFQPADKLDLAGLLNVLDGVVDSPGRIVIMTTNHPEKLDAALIRPGRINCRLLFTFMQAAEMLQMLTHHYGNISHQDELQVRSILKHKNDELLADGDENGFCISPAEVEQLCAEADTLADFCAALRRFPDFSNEYHY